MKKISIFSAKAIALFLFSFVLFGACKGGDKPSPDALDKDTSYAFGMFTANMMAGQLGNDFSFDYSSFTEGFKAYYEAKETRLTPEQAMEKINAAFMAMQSRGDEIMQAEGEKNRIEGEAFLSENRARSGVMVTPSGLQYEVIADGSGPRPAANDDVRVHYEGTLIDGTVFDSSYERGEPVEFNLSMVIPGWTEGVQLMNEGSSYRFFIPSDLAYGPQGAGGSVPPNAVLIFKVELLSVLK